MFESLNKVINGYGLISGFAIIGVTMAVSYWLSARLTRGRLHGSAIAIFLGLVLSYVGGVATGGQKGLVDVPLMSGIGLLGGAMLCVGQGFPGWCRCSSGSVRRSSPGSRWPWRSATPMRSA